MIVQSITAVIAMLPAAACAPDPTSAPKPSLETPAPRALDTEAVLAIAAELAIQKGMTEACEGSGTDPLSPFINELRDLGASADLIANVEQVTTELYVMARDEEPEYLCTPDMFEGAMERVAKAQQDWSAIRESAE